MTDNQPPGFLPPYGNYRELLSYQKAEIVYDVTFHFCERFLSRGDRTIDQLVQAARSGKQNIAEGSKAAHLYGDGHQADQCSTGQFGRVVD